MLYHSSLGKHRRRKTRYLAKSYIWGAGAINLLAVGTCCYFISHIFVGKMNTTWLLITIGALLATSIVMWALYYRNQGSTELWLPRSFVRYIRRKSREVNDDISAFSLGMLSAFAEMPISIALYIVAGNAIVQMSENYQIVTLLGYALLSVLPMFVLKLRIKSGSSVVAAQRWRLKNRGFTQVTSGAGFLVLGLFILAFWVM